MMVVNFGYKFVGWVEYNETQQSLRKSSLLGFASSAPTYEKW